MKTWRPGFSEVLCRWYKFLVCATKPVSSVTLVLEAKKKFTSSRDHLNYRPNPPSVVLWPQPDDVGNARKMRPSMKCHHDVGCHGLEEAGPVQSTDMENRLIETKSSSWGSSVYACWASTVLEESSCVLFDKHATNRKHKKSCWSKCRETSIMVE